MAAEGVGITVVDRLWLDAMPPGRVEHRPWTPGVTSSFGLIHPSTAPVSDRARALGEILIDIFRSRYGVA